MTDEQLLTQLQGQGLLDAAVANRLRRDALVGDEPVEAILWRERLVDDTKIAAVKSASLKVPYKAIDIATVDQKLISMIPEETARTYGIIPLSFNNNLF